jgi:hypothetical protein
MRVMYLNEVNTGFKDYGSKMVAEMKKGIRPNCLTP